MQPEQKPTGKRSVLKSHALSVFVVLLIINIALLGFNPFDKAKLENLPADHSWVYWMTRDLLKLNKAPDVVYVGSSLFMHPLTMQDARYLNRPIDYVDHHRSIYTEDKISEKLLIDKPICFNAGLPGNMVSDDWILIETLLKEDKVPKVIILGLTARDFFDCSVKYPAATPVFKYLSRLIDVEPIIDLAMPNLWERTDHAVAKIVYLWGNKPNVQTLLAENAKQMFLPLTDAICGGRQFSEAQREELLTMNINAQLERGWMVEPPDRDRDFVDNRREYTKRYRSRRPQMWNAQKEFFQRLLNTASDRNIQLVVVNMPITNLNVDMLPSGVYADYLEMVKTMTESKGFRFADLQDDNRFPGHFYYDTVHMNSRGGKELVHAIVEILSDDGATIAALHGDTRRELVERKNAWN